MCTNRVLVTRARRPLRSTVRRAVRTSSSSSVVRGTGDTGREAGDGTSVSATSREAPKTSGACTFHKSPENFATLPNGIRVKFVSKPDVQFLYDEIFRDDCYRRHGLRIENNSTIIDVGGNIGLFALFASAIATEGKVFVLEPIPKTFDALATNLKHAFGGAEKTDDENFNTSEKRDVACFHASAAEGVLRRTNTKSSGSLTAKEKESVAAEKQGGVVNPSGSNQRGVGSITAYNVGVGDGTETASTFTFYPRAAGWSSMSPDPNEVTDNVRLFVEARLGMDGSEDAPGDGSNGGDGSGADGSDATSDNRAAGSGATSDNRAAGSCAEHHISQRIGSLHPLAKPGAKLLRFSRKGKGVFAFVAKFIFAAATWLVTRYLLGGKQIVVCPLVTVSDVINAHGLLVVDFLKIDVERAELATLLGVEPKHRQVIKQIAMEVHDDFATNGFGLADVVALLTDQDHGFGFEPAKVIVEQPVTLTGGTLWNVYARR